MSYASSQKYIHFKSPESIKKRNILITLVRLTKQTQSKNFSIKFGNESKNVVIDFYREKKGGVTSIPPATVHKINIVYEMKILELKY